MFRSRVPKVRSNHGRAHGQLRERGYAGAAVGKSAISTTPAQIHDTGRCNVTFDANLGGSVAEYLDWLQTARSAGNLSEFGA